MSIEGQGHFFTIYFPDFVCFVLYLSKISGERLQDHWSSGNYIDVYNSYSKSPITSGSPLIRTYHKKLCAKRIFSAN